MPAAHLLNVAVVVLLIAARAAGAACNLVPPVAGNFAGAKGVLDRPFSVPGPPVAVRLRSCDASSFSPRPEDHMITVALPGKGGKQNLVVVTATAGQCPPGDICKGSGVNKVVCRPVGTGATGMHFDKGSLRFPFPDSRRRLGNDMHVLSGRAAIAVTRSPDVACGLAASPCASQTGLVACVDELYEFEGDTACGTKPNVTFERFVALPRPNVFRDECWEHKPPCARKTSPARLEVAVDHTGNLLIPFAWEGIAPDPVGIKRLVRGFVRDFSGSVRLPTPEFISSYSPEGLILFPSLDVGEGHPVAVEASVDWPGLTVVRIARTIGRCKGGPNDGILCPGYCLGGKCQPVCPNETDCNPGCAQGTCGQLFDLDKKREGAIGPVVFRRPSHMICRHSHEACQNPRTCVSSDRCEGYALEADAHPLPLVPAVSTSALVAYVVVESIDGKDLNGDADTNDQVVVVTDGAPGRSLPIGDGAAQRRAVGRAVAQGSLPGAPVVAAEGPLLAFLESKTGQGQCAADGGGSILRAFVIARGRAEERTAGVILAADPASVLNGQSVIVSGGHVFYREPRGGDASAVLRVLDPGRDLGADNPRTLGPAARVAIADGVAAFIAPEPGSRDSVVRVWREGFEAVRVFTSPAEDVALSPSWIAASVRSDGRRRLAVRPTRGDSPREVARAADALAVSGALVVFVTAEREQRNDLNGDGDREDRVLQLYHADTDRLVNVEQQVEDFVLDERLVAFRTSERAQDGDLNDDGDRDDEVLQIYDVPSGMLINTREAAMPCPPPVCDPRAPYRITATQVRFLAPTRGDPIIKIFDVSARRTSAVAPLAVDKTSPGSDPLQDTNGSLLFPSRAGRCVPDAAPSRKETSCPVGTFRDPTLRACTLDTPSVCLQDTDCPGGAACAPAVVTLAVAMQDGDGDGIPDGIDARPSISDPAEVEPEREKACRLPHWMVPWRAR